MYEYNTQDKTEPFLLVMPRKTLIDHKENVYWPKFGPVCPSKSDIIKLSKIRLDKYIST